MVANNSCSIYTLSHCRYNPHPICNNNWITWNIAFI